MNPERVLEGAAAVEAAYRRLGRLQVAALLNPKLAEPAQRAAAREAAAARQARLDQIAAELAAADARLQAIA